MVESSPALALVLVQHKSMADDGSALGEKNDRQVEIGLVVINKNFTGGRWGQKWEDAEEMTQMWNNRMEGDDRQDGDSDEAGLFCFSNPSGSKMMNCFCYLGFQKFHRTQQQQNLSEIQSDN